jgi:hypothetical protein
MEHDGTSDPGSDVQALLWDGGNVEISVDAGNTWRVATPTDGYDGVIADGAGNPKAGQAAFGGYSFGWRRAVVPLPGGTAVQVRFDFASDVSNEEPSLLYAGWAIDDVTVRTDRIIDAQAPTVVEAPPPQRMEAVVGGIARVPRLEVTAVDNVGIESVRVGFTTFTSPGATQGSIRMAMRPDDKRVFQATIPIDTNRVRVGDRVEYRLEIRDFDGNSTTYPGLDEEPFLINFQTVLAVNTLIGARPSGGWELADTGWRLESPDVSLASLVLNPVDLAENATAARFEMEHSYRFDGGQGGNVQMSTDAGRTWSLIEPEGGYDGTVAGQPAFTGATVGQISAFDLLGDKGEQIRLRVDFVGNQTESSTFWQIRRAEVTQASASDEFDIPRELELHPNFPNPFQTSTTISYSVPSEGPVRLAVFDVTGRRVAVLADGVQEAGTYSITLEAFDLSAGVYFVRLGSGDRHIVRKIVRSR